VTDFVAMGGVPDIYLVDIASPNDTHAPRSRSRGGVRQMGDFEKPLGRNSGESHKIVKRRLRRRASRHGLV